MRSIHHLKYLWPALALGLILVAYPGGGALSAATPTPTATPVAAVDRSCDSNRPVQVSGAATINVVPDRVLVKLGIESYGITPQAAQTQNLAASQNIIKAVRSFGVAAKDISTDYYIVQPVYRPDGTQIERYRIDNVVAVTLTDANKASELLIRAFTAGANKVVDVQFYTSQLRRYRDQARALAVQAAKEKAQALASAADAKIGCVLRIDENSWSYYTGYWGWGRNQATMAQNVVQNAAPNGAEGQPPSEDTPVSLGQIAIRAEVNMAFSIE
jgi:uncharacterized protein YggE